MQPEKGPVNNSSHLSNQIEAPQRLRWRRGLCLRYMGWNADLLIPQPAQLHCLDTASPHRTGFSPQSAATETGVGDWGGTARPSQRSEQVGPAGMSPIGLVKGNTDIAFQLLTDPRWK